MSFYSEMMQNRQDNYPRLNLPICCRKAYMTYKGLRRPRCCGGKGCQVCWMIFRAKSGRDAYRQHCPYG